MFAATMPPRPPFALANFTISFAAPPTTAATNVHLRFTKPLQYTSFGSTHSPFQSSNVSKAYVLESFCQSFAARSMK